MIDRTKRLVGKDKKMLMVQVTYDCNYDCAHCAYGGMDDNQMSLEKFEKLINRYKDSYDVLKISGGEPTVVPEIKKYIRLAVPKFDRVILYTNGSNLKDVSDLDIDFLVSFYGSKHEAYTSESSRTYKQICALDSMPVDHNITINTPVFHKHQVHSVRHYAEKLDMPLRMVKLQNHGEARKNISVLPFKDQKRIAEEVIDVYNKAYATCSLLGEPRCDDKKTITPIGNVVRCTAEIKGLQCARFSDEDG